MTSYPSNWVSMALGALQAPVTGATIAVMRAWSKSTPLVSSANNPIGMPAGSSGAPKFLNTGYAIFPSMSSFYVALHAFARTSKGAALTNALSQEIPAPVTWRTIDGMGWPGSATETDYPGAVLDLTSATYRLQVSAAERPARKTSGMVGAKAATMTTILNQARSLHSATQTIADASARSAELLRRHGKDGG
jgi:hypothetical protein